MCDRRSLVWRIMLLGAVLVVWTRADALRVHGRVEDADTGDLLPCRVHIENAQGEYVPPVGHVVVPNKDRPNNSGITSEPDVNNRGTNWAFAFDGVFEVDLPAEDGATVIVEHGLEYERKTFPLDLAGTPEKQSPVVFKLKRGINMRERGWMSMDTHVHNLMPLEALRQMRCEALDYVNLMFIGPGHPLLPQFTGTPHAVSQDGYIVYVSQEIRDAQQGHMTLMGIKRPIMPIRVYTGQEVATQVPRPHEPLNWEVYDILNAQGALACHAHYLYWPGYGSAISAALGKLHAVEWLQPDLILRGPQTRQNIEVQGHPLTGAGPMWYHMLNCGARVPLIGGTDKMSNWRIVGGSNRTYVHAEPWSHEGAIEGIRRGETFVSNGPLLSLSADGRPIGSDLRFEGEGPFTVQVNAGCYTRKPISRFQVIQDGEVVYDEPVDATAKDVKVEIPLTFTKSGWLAVRVGENKSSPDNWEHGITAAHTSPIYVTVNGELPAVKASAEYMIARVQASITWSQTLALYSCDEYKKRALDSSADAQAFYREALARAE